MFFNNRMLRFILRLDACDSLMPRWVKDFSHACNLFYSKF